MAPSKRTLQETTTSLAPADVLARAKSFFAQRNPLYAAYPDRFAITGEGPTRSIEEIREAVLEALADEIRHMLEEGVVESPKDVDTALILGAGFPFFMGGLTKKRPRLGTPSENTTIRRRSRAWPGGRPHTTRNVDTELRADGS